LAHEVGGLDASIYHLDGIDAIRHLEAICSLENLDMIQWVPGAGQDGKDWSDLRRRIDELGKGQIYQSGNLTASEVKAIWEIFSSRKLYVHVRADAHDELKALLPE